MPTFQPTGHPDFLATSSTPIPVLVAEETGLAAGAWGPFTVNVSSGGAYELAVFPAVSGDSGCTDITVQHMDTAGNLVYTDFFGAVLCGVNSGALSGITMTAPTVIRGNLQGSQLVISGVTGASAFIRTVTGIVGLNSSAVNINVYILPIGLTDPEPRMCNGSAQLLPLGSTPGGILASLVSATVAFGGNVATAIVPYSGPAVIHLRQTGVVATPTNLRLIMQGFTVGNGSGTPVWQLNYATQAPVIGYEFDADIPACLCTFAIFNQDGAQTATVTANLTAAKTA
jgi:hypothetical protein